VQVQARGLVQVLELVQELELVQAPEPEQVLERAPEPEQVLVLERAPEPEQVLVLERALVLVLVLVQAPEPEQALEQAQVGASQPVPKPDRVRAAVITLRHGTCASGPGRPTSRRTMPATHRIRFARS
jgi:hypothetical protein